MKRTLMCATAAAAIVSAGQVANAEDGWYVRGDVSYSFDGRMDYDAEKDSVGSMGGDGDIGEGLLGLGFGVGYNFGNGFRIESNLTGRSGELDPDPAINGIIPAVNNGGVETRFLPGRDGSLQIYDLMFNGLYDFDTAGRWKPYLGGGVGLAQVRAKAHTAEYGVVDTNVTPAAFRGGGSANGFSDEETAFAWQGLAGVGYEISDRLTLDLGYKYFNVQGLDFDGRGPSFQSVEIGRAHV
jgi:OmpA-OmpF porin, OOP family